LGLKEKDYQGRRCRVLFDGYIEVNMPTLYGEGEKAFIRLQHEILKFSDDQTIFVWQISTPSGSSGLLAPSLAEFALSSKVRGFDSDIPRFPYSITNIGIRTQLPLIPRQDLPKKKDTFLTILNCRLSGETGLLGIYVQREKGEQFVRESPATIVIEEKEILSISKLEVVYVKEAFDYAQRGRYRRPRFLIKTLQSRELGFFSLSQTSPGRVEQPGGSHAKND
jgi:hypothetical protein